MGAGWIRANWRRVLFVAFGISLIGLGIGSEGGAAGLVLAAAGLIPLSAGLFGWCPAMPRDGDESESDGEGPNADDA